MNTKKLTTRWEEGGVSNERIPLRVDQVPIVGLDKKKEEVPLQEPQVPSEPQVPPMPQSPLLKDI